MSRAVRLLACLQRSGWGIGRWDPDFDAAGRAGANLAEGLCRGIVVVVAFALLKCIIAIDRATEAVMGDR